MRPDGAGISVLGLAGAVALAGVLAWCAVPAAAQSIQGSVVDAASDRPLPGALVRLTDVAGDTLGASVADDTGRFVLAVPGSGSYRLRVEQLGYEPHTSEPIEVREANAVVRVDLRLRAAPVPIRGVEVTADQMNRRLRQFFGMSPGQLRLRPVRRATLEDHAARGNDLPEMMGWLNIPNLQVLRSREGPCFQIRNRGCLPVYLDGARLNRTSIREIPLDMLGTVVVVLPNEVVAYPDGAVHLFTLGFMR